MGGTAQYLKNRTKKTSGEEECICAALHLTTHVNVVICIDTADRILPQKTTTYTCP